MLEEPPALLFGIKINAQDLLRNNSYVEEKTQKIYLTQQINQAHHLQKRRCAAKKTRCSNSRQNSNSASGRFVY